METVDDIMRMAIADVFPDQSVPDEENYLSDGTQFKAPDHSLFGGKILIERKSRNAVDRSQFYHKLQEIASQQGRPFYGVGKFRTDQVIADLPDSFDATRRIVDYSLNQIMKSIRSARRKFEEHSKFVADAGQIRIVVVSDNSKISGSTATEEYFIGRKMGAYGQTQDETGVIDAIFFVKNPQYVFDDTNSYWFKYLLKRRVQHADQGMVTRVAAALHHRIAHHASFYPRSVAMQNGRLRLLVV